MICSNYKDVESVDLGNGLKVRWLTHKDLGGDEYIHNHALRHFTVAPGTNIALQSHKYVQIMYILSGRLIFSVADKEGNRTEREVGPGDFIYTYSYEEHGEARLKPCAEAFLSDRAAEAILARGIMPVRSYANRNAAQLARFQSVADPPHALAGL